MDCIRPASLVFSTWAVEDVNLFSTPSTNVGCGPFKERAFSACLCMGSPTGSVMKSLKGCSAWYRKVAGWLCRLSGMKVKKLA